MGVATKPGNAILSLDAQFQQQTGRRVRASVELPIGDAIAFELQGGLIAASGGLSRRNVAEKMDLPVIDHDCALISVAFRPTFAVRPWLVAND